MLLLDEAISALDSKTEEQVTAGLRSATVGPVILVAHRLSTVRGADNIVVLCGGLARRGLYYQALQLQSLSSTEEKKRQSLQSLPTMILLRRAIPEIQTMRKRAHLLIVPQPKKWSPRWKGKA